MPTDQALSLCPQTKFSDELNHDKAKVAVNQMAKEATKAEQAMSAEGAAPAKATKENAAVQTLAHPQQRFRPPQLPPPPGTNACGADFAALLRLCGMCHAFGRNAYNAGGPCATLPCNVLYTFPHLNPIGEEGRFELPRARAHWRRRGLLRRLHPAHDETHCGNRYQAHHQLVQHAQRPAVRAVRETHAQQPRGRAVRDRRARRPAGRAVRDRRNESSATKEAFEVTCPVSRHLTLAVALT
eukprot:scaffold5380_cov62-Phaeocystis_antarctica.AAC.1